MNWLHVSSTARLTYYKRHQKRVKATLDAIGILPRFEGRAIHDGWSAYQHYGCAHSLCNAHHLRELTALFEQEQQAWAGQMPTLLVAMKRAIDTAKEQGQSRLYPLCVCAFEGRYRQLL